jgi:hypothetical protein
MDRRDSWSVSKFDIKQSLCEAQRQQLVSLGIKILGVVSLIVILVLYFSSLKPRPAFDTSKIPHYLYHSTGVTLFGGKVTLAKEGLLDAAGNEKILAGLQKRLEEQKAEEPSLELNPPISQRLVEEPMQKVKVVQEGNNWKLIKPLSTKDVAFSHENNKWSFVVDVREGVKFPVLKNQIMLSVDLGGMEQSVPEVAVFIRRQGEKEVKAPLAEELEIQPQGKQGQAYVYKILLNKILRPGEQIALQVSWEGSAQAATPNSP